MRWAPASCATVKEESPQVFIKNASRGAGMLQRTRERADFNDTFYNTTPVPHRIGHRCVLHPCHVSSAPKNSFSASASRSGWLRLDGAQRFLRSTALHQVRVESLPKNGRPGRGFPAQT